MDLYADDAVQRMHDGIFEGLDAIRDRLARDLDAFADANYVVDSFVDMAAVVQLGLVPEGATA